MRFTLILLSALQTIAIALAQQSCISTVVGDLRVEHFQSKMYGVSMTVRIWLPQGYLEPKNASRMYPTLYMLDGQTLFDECTAFKGEHELRLDETVSKLILDDKIQPIVIVGIDSTEDRTHECAPKKPHHGREQARAKRQATPRFFAEELIPWVKDRYRVTNDVGDTAIGGTSLGAAAALYVSLQRPDLFGLALLQSPSLLLGNGQLLRDTVLLARAPDRTAIGVGGTEFNFQDIDSYFAPYRLSRLEAEAGNVKMMRLLQRI